jgi:phosphoribosylaminoimidazole-succinocarboxamide synthase
MANGFQGQHGQQIPTMTDEIVENISNRYIELYEQIIGERFCKADTSTVLKRVEKAILCFLQQAT